MFIFYTKLSLVLSSLLGAYPQGTPYEFVNTKTDTVMHRGPPITTTRSMALLLRFRYKVQGL